MRLASTIVTGLIVCVVTPVAAQTRVEKNVVYGTGCGSHCEHLRGISAAA